MAGMVCVGGYSETSRVTPPVTALGCEFCVGVYSDDRLWLSCVIGSLVNRVIGWEATGTSS